MRCVAVRVVNHKSVHGRHMQIQYLAVAAVILLFFDSERVVFAILFGVVAAVLIIVLEIFVPRDTGLISGSMQFANFAATIIGTCAILFTVVFHAIRETARAEATAERERSRSDSLLANILPAAIADRLKGHAEALIADRYDEASILFADMAGFTARASHTDPEDLVRFLNRVFTVFDRLVERHGLEKIKMTGDSYMVVAGAPFAAQARDAALTTASTEIKWMNGWSAAAAAFEGEFSKVTHSYAGKGSVRYAW